MQRGVFHRRLTVSSFNTATGSETRTLSFGDAERCLLSEAGSLGPVVQSIVSLTTSLIRQFIKYVLTTLSNPLLLFFLLKKCENLLHTFFQQKITVDL